MGWLANSLLPESGVVNYLPTALNYNRRLKKQADKLEEERRKHELRMKRLRADREERERERRHREETAKFKATNPQAYMQQVNQQNMRALQNIQYGSRITGIYM